MLPPSVISGHGGARNGNQRIHADFVGDAETLAAGIDKLASQILGGSKGNRMHEDVELAVLLFQGREKSIDLLVAGDVALETRLAPGSS